MHCAASTVQPFHNGALSTDASSYIIYIVIFTGPDKVRQCCCPISTVGSILYCYYSVYISSSRLRRLILSYIYAKVRPATAGHHTPAISSLMIYDDGDGDGDDDDDDLRWLCLFFYYSY